jgi:hypothetical protein
MLGTGPSGPAGVHVLAAWGSAWLQHAPQQLRQNTLSSGLLWALGPAGWQQTARATAAASETAGSSRTLARGGARTAGHASCCCCAPPVTGTFRHAQHPSEPPAGAAACRERRPAHRGGHGQATSSCGRVGMLAPGCASSHTPESAWWGAWSVDGSFRLASCKGGGDGVRGAWGGLEGRLRGWVGARGGAGRDGAGAAEAGGAQLSARAKTTATRVCRGAGGGALRSTGLMLPECV